MHAASARTASFHPPSAEPYVPTAFADKVKDGECRSCGGLVELPLDAESRSANLGGMWILLLFMCVWLSGWTLGCAFILEQIVNSLLDGMPAWVLIGVSVPFSAFELFGLAVVLSMLGAKIAPRVRLFVKPGLIFPGEAVEFAWQITGRWGLPRRLTVDLEGLERTTQGSGDDEKTEQTVFYRQRLLEVETPREIAAAEGRFTVPADAVHSLDAANNKIVWRIRLGGSFPRWRPDVDLGFAVLVPPDPRRMTKPTLDRRSAEDSELLSMSTAARHPAVQIRLADERSDYRPGQTVVIEVECRLPEADRNPAIQLVWLTTGVGNTDTVVVTEQELSAPRKDLTSFEFVLPEGPWSLVGNRMQIHWLIRVVRPRLILGVSVGMQTLCEVPITLTPSGRVLRLPRDVDAASIRT